MDSENNKQPSLEDFMDGAADSPAAQDVTINTEDHIEIDDAKHTES